MIRAAAQNLAVMSLGLGLMTAPAAFAQSTPRKPQGLSIPAPTTHFTPERAALFAKSIEQTLAMRGTRLAIVFRTGRPREVLPEGIDYTHGAFWVYGEMTGSDGKPYKGYAVYNLYRGDGVNLPVDQSYLMQDFPYEFVMASAEDDVAVIIPSPEMQKRIIGVIASPAYNRLHVKSYSLVSNPANARHQNCTEFVLDVIAAAAWQTDSYPQIKANLAANFKPTEVRASLVQKLFGPMVDPGLAIDDQSGPILTADEASITAFMRANKLLSDRYVMTPDPPETENATLRKARHRANKVWIPLDPKDGRSYGGGEPQP
jgi:hypothetical protein